jgi:hypothetical protein
MPCPYLSHKSQSSSVTPASTASGRRGWAGGQPTGKRCLICQTMAIMRTCKYPSKQGKKA